MTPTRRLLVLDVVGLTPALLGPDAPHLTRLARNGFMAPMESVMPAVTCTGQATMLTGRLPRDHGIVGNGWYFRDLAEVWLWRQSNRLVHGEKVWEAARRSWPGTTAAKLFWWYNMYSSVDWSVTLKPMYPADGRKIPALYSAPNDLHRQLEAEFGAFPMFNFWGPASGIESSRWIARATGAVARRQQPDLLFAYLPHLDYGLQRLGPADPAIAAELRAVDAVVGELLETVRAEGYDVLVVSEYGIESVHDHVAINRLLREHGYLAVRETVSGELLDYGASRAFAVADHQVAHVYVSRYEDLKPVQQLLAATPGIGHVLDEAGKAQWGIDHERSGELIAIADPGFWFTYYYWVDDARAPDFARTVDIHRKPGYDPLEMFIDPDIRFPRMKIARRLLQKRLGMRMLMDVVPLRPDLIKGSHGRPPTAPDRGPLVIGSRRDLGADRLHATEVKDLILRHFDQPAGSG